MSRASYTHSMTEKQLQQAIVNACDWLGFMVYHTYDSRRSRKGFPDLCIVGYGHVLFLELKSAKGKPTPEQSAWIAALSRVQNPPIAQVIRPDDLDSCLNLLKALRTSTS